MKFNDTYTPAEHLANIDALIAALSRERDATVQAIVESATGDIPKTSAQPDLGTGPEWSRDTDTQPTPGSRIISHISHILQADDRWKKENMGAVGYMGCKIGAGGCALSALCALAEHHLQRKVTPITLNRFLQENGGYAPDSAMIVWGAFAALLKKYGLTASHRRVSHPGDVPRVVREQIDQDCPVVLRMRGSKGPHFLLAIGYTEDDIITHDPGTWRGNGYGTDSQPPCTLKNPTRELTLEGAEVYEISGTPTEA